MNGIYAKRGWLYYQAPKPPGGTRPKAIALKTRDWVAAMDAVDKMRYGQMETAAALAGTVDEALPLYLSARAEDTKATRRAREVILSGFRDILGNPRLKDLNPAMIATWRTHLEEKGGTLNGRGQARPASKRSYLITVRAFLNWCRKQGMLDHDPLSEIRHLAKVNITRRQKFLTVDERERLLALPMKDYAKLILHLGFFAGLRHEEMLALNPDWIWIADDKSRGTITVQDTEITFDDGPGGTAGSKGTWTPKGKRARIIPMHPRLLACILDHGMRRPWMLAPDRPLWPADHKNSKRFDPKKALGNLAKKAGVEKVNYHILRHSFATHLAIAGVELSKIAALLGDSLKVAEDHYAGYAPNSGDSLLKL